MTHPGPAAPDPQLADTAPVCYRHPDRETYIRCQRCGRPICPDDMHPASVGFHCPECVREGNATVRAPRTVLGGAVRGRDATVTMTVIGLCVVMYGLQLVVPEVAFRLELIGGYLSTSGDVQGVAGGDYWRLLTSGFLHGGVIHLAVNMFSLWVLGRPLEAALGRLRFAALYLVGLLGANAVAYLLTPPGVPVVGASGAIFALLGALFVLGRRLGLDLRSLSGVLVINLVISFTVPNISWQAHLGGLVTGALVAAGLLLTTARRRLGFTVGGYALALMLAAGVVAYRTVALTS